MRKRLLSVVLVSTFIMSSCMTVCAAPKAMADGEMFDAEYYIQNNPDVAGVLGTDANVLYEHYKNFGKAEGRKPYAEAVTNEAATGSSVPTGFATVHINQKNGIEGVFSVPLAKEQFPGIDDVEHIKGLDLQHQVDKIRHGNTSSMVNMIPGGITEQLMSYVIGGSGIIESYVKNSPTEYSFYILNNGLRYRFDLHFNENLRIQSFDYGMVGTVTEQEMEAAKINLPNFEHKVQYHTKTTWTEEELASFR